MDKELLNLSGKIAENTVDYFVDLIEPAFQHMAKHDKSQPLLEATIARICSALCILLEETCGTDRSTFEEKLEFFYKSMKEQQHEEAVGNV